MEIFCGVEFFQKMKNISRRPQSLSNLPQTSSACAPIVLNMHKKFEVSWTKIKGGSKLYTKVAIQQSWSDLTLEQQKNVPTVKKIKRSFIGNW